VARYLSKELPLPELMPTDMSFHMLALMQNEGFDSYIQSNPSASSSKASIGSTTSALSVGR